MSYRVNGIRKKSTAPSGKTASTGFTVHTVTIAAIDRGLTLEGVMKMDLGAILDYCKEWNEIHRGNDEEESGGVGIRDATQEDIDRFLG